MRALICFLHSFSLINTRLSLIHSCFYCMYIYCVFSCRRRFKSARSRTRLRKLSSFLINRAVEHTMKSMLATYLHTGIIFWGCSHNCSSYCKKKKWFISNSALTILFGFFYEILFVFASKRLVSNRLAFKAAHTQHDLETRWAGWREVPKRKRIKKKKNTKKSFWAL